MARAVFLDRDGVLVRAHVREGRPYAPLSLDDMELETDAQKSVARLRQSGLLSIVITNQPDVARGAVDRETVEAMHSKLLEFLALDGILACYHDDSDECNCRKPKPGMLVDAASAFEINLGQSFMIGDRWRDIGAGMAAGCTTIWIDRGYDEPKGDGADYTVSSLSSAVLVIVALMNGNPHLARRYD